MRKAKDLDPELPVILITGFAEVRRRGGGAARRRSRTIWPSLSSISSDPGGAARAQRAGGLKLELEASWPDHVHHVLSPRETFGPSEGHRQGGIAANQAGGQIELQCAHCGRKPAPARRWWRGLFTRPAARQAAVYPVDCGAVPEMLFESELFGHERGAFTRSRSSRRWARSRWRTTARSFLDEIPNILWLPRPKLLRMLQEKILYRVGGPAKPIGVDTRDADGPAGQNLESSLRARLSAPIFSSGSTSSPSRCRPCASDARISLPGQALHWKHANSNCPSPIRGFSPSATGPCCLPLAGQCAPVLCGRWFAAPCSRPRI